MKTLWVSMNPKPKDINEFKSQLSSNKNLGNSPLIKSKLNLNPTTRNQWDLTNKSVIDLKNRSEKLAGQRGADTLQSEYGNDSVINAVQEIVKKRISFFTRIAKLKNPSAPFTNLILDVFKYPEQYDSGAKKFTSDFEAVDKLYISDLIKIAKAAKQFYASEIANLKLIPPQTQQNASLNLFDLWVGEILSEANKIEIRNINNVNYFTIKDDKGNVKFNDTEKNVLNRARQIDKTITSLGLLKQRGDVVRQLFQQPSRSTSTQTPQKPQGTPSQTPQQSQQILNTLKQNALSDKEIPNRIAFLSGQPIKYVSVDPKTGKDTNVVNDLDTKKYTVKFISSLKTNEAKVLIDTLNSVASYSKSRMGAGELIKKTGQALASAGQAGKSFAGVT
jgi:hypothetical protein